LAPQFLVGNFARRSLQALIREVTGCRRKRSTPAGPWIELSETPRSRKNRTLIAKAFAAISDNPADMTEERG
jgi:hypothetical protein